MKILIVSQYFWPEDFRINDVTRTLVERGMEIEVLTGKPNYPKGSIYAGYKAWGCQHGTEFGAVINRVPLLARGKGALRLALNYLSFIITGMLFAPWLLRRKKFDIIFVYGLSPILSAIPAIFLGRIKGCPVVLWVQDLWPGSLSATGYVRNPLVLKLVEYVVRFIYRHTDLLLVQSEAFIDPVSALAGGTPVVYYPNSVDESFAVPTTTTVPDVPGLGSGGFSVVFAGNIGAAQAVEVIIEAATWLKEYVDIQFIILGDGSRREWMLQEAKNRNLPNLHLPGRFPVETMPGFMQKASALLVTLSDQPIFALTVPNKVQAYMATGRPILACLNGEGARLVVEAEVGLAVPAGNGNALAEAVLKLYRMAPMEREKLGNNGRSYYKEHFDHDSLINKLIRHFEVALHDGKEVQ
jgi:glycosyltransferase involved in cell wall biosynthesis